MKIILSLGLSLCACVLLAACAGQYSIPAASPGSNQPINGGDHSGY